MSAQSTVGFVRAIEPEDRLRADFYALFARLFFAPPDADLLHTMSTAPLLSDEVDDAPLAAAWAKLAAAASVMDAEAARDEYETLFGGVGKSLVTLFASYYASHNTPGQATRYLVDLRKELDARGIALIGGTGMPEDHCAAVFETMRMLIAGSDEVAPASREAGHAFYKRFVATFHEEWCTAIMHQSVANFYRAVAECAHVFLIIEDEAVSIA